MRAVVMAALVVLSPGWAAAAESNGERSFEFGYHGYLRAPMRVGIGKRLPEDTPGYDVIQGETTLHEATVPDDQYLSFQSTAHNMRSWAEAVFEYGNGVAKASMPADPVGGGAGGSGGAPSGITLVPDASGWVDRMAEGNTVGVQGTWYPYGDKYGVAKCTSVGLHQPGECSTITSPDPLVAGFPNQDGNMCTEGETAVVLPCPAGVPGCMAGSPDYSNMWGAGIGLDLNAEGGVGGAKLPWNAETHGVTGIAFELDVIPAGGLRVEFPIVLPEGGHDAGSTLTTEDHPDGSPYWGATPNFPPSPVRVGRNEVRFSSVTPPRTSYNFDETKLLAIQFHVPAVTIGTTRSAYRFCIKNLTFLKD